MLITYRSDRNTSKFFLNANILVLLGYALVFLETAIAKLIGLTDIPFSKLLLVTAVVAAWSIILFILIIRKNSYSVAFERFFYFSHLIVYLCMYGIWVYLLYDFRIFALFSSLLAIIIVLSYTNIIQSLIMSISTVIVFLIATYLSVNIGVYKQTFVNDLFFAVCFLPPAVIISIIANYINKKNSELETSKEYLEEVNGRLILLNRELEQNQKMAKIEMELAYDIQKSLLPPEPINTKNWDIALSYKPRFGVSGDFYDFYYENDVLSGLSLFDVSGHGIASGLITILAKPIFSRCFNRFRNEPLERVMEVADYTLKEDLNDVSMYITGILMRFRENYFEYINAGHPDALYKTKDSGDVKSLSSIVSYNKFHPIGLIDSVTACKSVKVTPKKGDSVLLYTDCITETNNYEKCRYGTERLIESYKQAPIGTAKEMLDFIVDRFYYFLDEKEIDDDCTVIVAKKT